MNKDNHRSIIAIVSDFFTDIDSVVDCLKKKYEYEVIESVSDINDVKAIANDMTKMKQVIKAPLNLNMIQYLLSKAAFALVYVTSPVKIRFHNFAIKYLPGNYDSFLDKDFEFSTSNEIVTIKTLAKYIITLNDTDINSISLKIDALIENIKKFRPNWNDYFMSVAHEVAERCNCVKSKVGAVIVKDNRIISVGYNGTPSKLNNCYDGYCERCWSDVGSGKDLDKCICIHAEENALLEAGRQKCIGGKVYCTLYPCLTCAKHIIQSGIEEVVYDVDYDSKMTKEIFAKANIKVTKWEKKKITII